ncbi:hypothetical protein B5F41_07985 [Gordonibacter sp. An232A]|nr:hypothetical protein B5F41_07985 [Gordonibacter sp. An232A]
MSRSFLCFGRRGARGAAALVDARRMAIGLERGWLGDFRRAAGRAFVSVKPGLMRAHVCQSCFDRDALGAIAQNHG